LHVDDLARACILLLERYDESEPINVGFGTDISIKDLALLIKKVVGFDGDINWDESKPNGTPKKLLDSSRIFDLGWRPQKSLEDGLASTYEWYVENKTKTLLGNSK
jgi:GDP-L-fucose synthase